MSVRVGPELRNALERALAGERLELAGPVELRPSPYRTSFPIEELEVELVGRGPVRLGCKRLDWEELTADAQLAKPRFLHDPAREPAVYRSLLCKAPAGPPEFFGAVVEAERSWLFLEWIEGRELYQVGDLRLWEAAARWLGEMHVALAADLDRHSERGRLLDYDEAHYRRWLERAVQFARAPGQPASRARSIEWLAGRYDEVVEGLLAMPRSVVHGELYASNVLIGGALPAPRVAPVDWELAAAAPGIVDLAALISGGGWDAEDREGIVAAYRSVVGSDAFSPRQLDFARLQVAIQWLGWAPPSWAPPPGQRHDWLGEAVALAEELEL